MIYLIFAITGPLGTSCSATCTCCEKIMSRAHKTGQIWWKNRRKTSCLINKVIENLLLLGPAGRFVVPCVPVAKKIISRVHESCQIWKVRVQRLCHRKKDREKKRLLAVTVPRMSLCSATCTCWECHSQLKKRQGGKKTTCCHCAPYHVHLLRMSFSMKKKTTCRLDRCMCHSRQVHVALRMEKKD